MDRSAELDIGPPATGVRLPWWELPPAVHTWAADVLAAPVVDAVTQPGGFSPGVAARLRCADGTRAFCKAVSSLANPHTPDMHRAEARTAAALPRCAPVPRLLASYDDGTWVALLFADVAGRSPSLPWRENELTRVLDALAELSESLTPSPLPDIAAARDELADLAGGFQLLASGPAARLDRLDRLDPWSRRHLDRLVELESRWAPAVAGDTLLHCDLRADNLLLSADRVWVVDWPSACRGAAWVDPLLFAPSVAMQGGPPPEELMARHPATRGAEPEAVDAVLAMVLGYLSHRALQPAPPGLPTLRVFQAAQQRVAQAWLARRTGWA